MAFYLTTNLRQYNAGALMIGQTYLQIPPFAVGHTEVGSCPGGCTRQIMTSKIHVTDVSNHMHFLGKRYQCCILKFIKGPPATS
ncbi:hypothetical protein DPMN_146494 [Dreissena polymorpha]|uniref:Uncharacterized protein n=1 Tax=Dreissena polymorpha TaxID=45954 RepID=A0A9D4FBV1_DREPO|nr:hypothetical protein DPMN_146494 [Dreissena polymorpha]